MSRQKGPDEVFCEACGEAIKQASELCPHCGVRNAKYDPTAGTTASTSQPTGGATTGAATSDTWWYGVAAGTGLWVLVVVASVFDASLGSVGGMLILIAWIGLPLSMYYDIQYVRANSEWAPETVLWVILSAVWIVNIAAGAVYLYRRHETLGEP